MIESFEEQMPGNEALGTEVTREDLVIEMQEELQ